MTETLQIRFYSGEAPNKPLKEDKRKSIYLGDVPTCFGAVREAPWSQMGDVLFRNLDKVI